MSTSTPRGKLHRHALSPFFVNRGTLTDELSFVHHFHSHPAILISHMLSLCVLTPVVLTLLDRFNISAFGFPVSNWLVALYAATFLSFDPAAGSLLTSALVAARYMSVVGFQGIAGPYIDGSKRFLSCGEGDCIVPSSALFGIVIGCFLGQVMAHVVWQGKPPAFRLFEALCTTPFYIGLSLLFAVGYDPAWRTEIVRESPRWKTWKRA